MLGDVGFARSQSALESLDEHAQGAAVKNPACSYAQSSCMSVEPLREAVFLSEFN